MAPRARQARHRFVDALDGRGTRITRPLPPPQARRGGLGWGHAAVAAQNRKKQMILPFALDAEVFAGVPLLLETGSCQQGSARDVRRQAGGLDPVQAEPIESELEDQRQRGRHITLPCKGLADPITKAGCFGDPAPEIGQADPADERIVMGEDEEIVGLVGAPILSIAAYPGAETGAAECIGWSVRLPWREKISRACAQARPGVVIAALRDPQKHAIPGRPERIRAGEKQSRKRPSLRRHLLSQNQVASRVRNRSNSSSRLSNPNAAKVGGAERQRATTRRIAASSTASMRRTISGGSNGVPWIRRCCASCSQRAEVLSSDIRRPAFICALARLSSIAVNPSSSLIASSHSAGTSSAASSSPVPA